MEKRSPTESKVLISIIGLTIILALLAGFFSTNQNVKEYERNTPEGVVQSFLNEVIKGQNDKAASYFSIKSICKAEDIDRSWIPKIVRANLVNSETDNDTALIRLAIDISSGDPFGDSYTEEHVYRLIKENNIWKLLGIPWPLNTCDGQIK